MALFPQHPHLSHQTAPPPCTPQPTRRARRQAAHPQTAHPPRLLWSVPLPSLHPIIHSTPLSLANSRDKVIPLQDLEVSAIQQKVQLLLDASGAKIKHLSRSPVSSSTEATRGIWSGLHADRPLL